MSSKSGSSARGVGGFFGRGMHEEVLDDDARCHVFVTPVGLLPWAPGGVRGGFWIAVLVIAVVGWGWLHYWWETPALMFIVWWVGAYCTKEHPFWPEILFRNLFQPIGWRGL